MTGDRSDLGHLGRQLVVGDPVVVLGEHHDVIADGAVIVEGRTIVAVGPRAELELRGPFDRVVGSPDHLVMPGFVNAHFHSTAMAYPGMFEYVFERQNVRSIRSAHQEGDLRAATLMQLMRCIRGGQTSIVDFGYGAPDMAEFGQEVLLGAYEEIGIRASLGIVTRDQNIYVHGDNERFLAMLPTDVASQVAASTMGYAWPVDEVLACFRRLHAKWDGRDGRIRVMLAPDWTPACSDELYRLNRQIADELGCAITTHALETRSEMVFNLSAYGKTAMRRLADIGFLGPDVSLAHFVWASDEDIQILADTGSVAVNNPASNLRLSTGVARVRDILDSGAAVAFGTDGISFSDDDDYFQELRLAAYLQRTPGPLEVGRLDSAQLLRAAIRNGAQALGQTREVGSLDVGKEADLLVLTKERFAWPRARYANVPVLDVLVDRAAGCDVRDVMIGGRLVLADGEFTTIDESAVADAYLEATELRMWKPTPQALANRALVAAVEPAMFEFYRGWDEIPVEPAHVYNARRPPAPAQLPGDRP